MGKKIRTGIVTVLAAIFALAVVIAPKTALAADIDQVLYKDDGAGINVRFEASDGAIEKKVTVNVYVDGDLKNTTELSGVRQTGARVYVEADHYDVSASINNSGTAEYISGLGYVNVNLGGPSDYVLNVNLTKNGDIDQVLYADEENGINVHFEADEGAIKKNVNVSVYVEGELKSTTALTGVPQSGSHVNITADGYDCYPEIDGGGTAVYIAGQDYVNVNLGTGDTNNLTISLARDKVGGDNTIADETTEYGTFSWVNSTNVNCAFLRTVTVYVDDNPEPVATDTIVTPENLSNSEGSANHQYWFTPNTLLYKTSDVRIEPSTTLNSTVNRHISVYLTSLCGCGLDTCVCDGGCDCPVDCDCDYCTGAVLGENQINTGYGILGYIPYGSEEDGSGYNLTVKLYVNGVLAWDELSDQPLRIKGAGDGNGDYLHNLEFEPASGYYYFAHEVNPYDLDTYGDAASTWDQSQGRLDFADTREEMRNYHNVLNIYLWTFPNSVNLNVEKMPAVGDEVWNYTISYDLPDPKTGEMRTWTYNATSFDAAQAQIIPTNTPVTLTGVCEPGKEVEQWRCEDASNLVLGNGIDFTDPAGNEEANGRIVKNASAVLNVRNSFYTTVTVYIDRFAWAKAPTPEEIQEILGESAVTVDCVSPYVSHEPETYALADGTFTVGNPYEDGDGYYVDVTVTPDSYIAAYNEGGSEHALADPDQDKVITFSHDGTKWVAKDGESPLVLEVMCDDAPDAPTDEQIKDLIGDVKVDCVNDEAYHVTGTYALMDNYDIGGITGDVKNGFTVDVAVPAEDYVAQYSTETNVAHELVEGAGESAVVTLVNTGEGWKVQSGTPVVFDVVCANVPEVPTFDELEKIFADGLVTVDCTNDEVDPAHADKTYGVLKGSYLFGDVTFDGASYTVTMDVYPALYAQQYSVDATVNHWLDPADQAAKQVTLTYANDAWTADDSAAITVSVKCANETEVPPVPPTGDELNGLEGADITVTCVTEGSEHAAATYDPISGAYSYGPVTDNGDGTYSVTMTTTPYAYVNEYVKTNGEHTIVDATAQSITLTYANDAWSVNQGSINYNVECVEPEPVIPDVPTPGELDAIFGDALVNVDCVNATVEHGDATYGAIAGGYLFGDVTANGDGTYSVTMDVYPAAYAQQYSVDTQVNHWLDPASQAAQQLTLTYNGTSWTAPAGFQTITVTVDCEDAAPEVPPVPPTGDELAAITGADITVTCTGEGSHGYVSYDPIAGAYTFGEVTKGADGTYSVTMTVLPGAYVDQFVAEIGDDHVLAEGENVAKTLTLTYDGAAWNAASEAINYNVVCVEDEPSTPEVPDMPTPDEVKALLGDDAVLIDCVNEDADHADKTYALVDGAFTINPVEGDETNGYTCSVTVTPHTYVALYEQDMQKAHELVDGQSATTIGLKLDNGAWVLSDPAAQISYQVVCADESGTDEPTIPTGPTPEEVKDLLADGAVTIDCVNTDVQHDDVTYDIVDGAYTIGAVEQAEDGTYTVDVVVRAGHYVLEFEEAHEGIHHWLEPDQAEKTITLVYDAENAEWTLPEGAAPVTFTVMCETAAEEPGTDEPGTDEPGTNEPGADEPGTDEPGTDEPGTTVPGGDKPGTDEPTTDDPDTTHTVTIVFGNGDPDQPVEVDEGELLPRPADPTRDGYTFAGWFTTKNPDGTLSDPYDFSKPVTGDFTLYAGWTLNGGTTTARPSAGVPATGDPTSVAALVATLVAGAGASTAGIALKRRNR